MSDDIDYDALLADAPSPEHIQIVAFEGLQYGLIDVEQYTAMHEAIRALRAAAVESERDAARYRFQHDNCLTFSPSRRLWELRDAAFLVVATGTAYTYEQAVDAAMAAQEKAQQQKEGE